MESTTNKNNYLKKIIIPSVILVSILLVAYFSWNKKSDIEINIMDTNSSISTEIDNFIKSNLDNPGVHTLKQDGYNYLLIVSNKEKATEMSINLYNVYKHKSKINVEYEVEVNEDTISESNPDKVQTMLIRFKESGKVNPIEVNKE